MTTEKYSTYIAVAQLKAALLFASKDDVLRQYLNGVCVEHRADGARLIATDGHRLICINLGEGVDGEAKAAQTVRYIVGDYIVASAVKLYAKSTAIVLTYERDHSPDPERPGVTVVSAARVKVGEISTTDKAEAFGKFPEYERIIPSKASGKLAQFNSSYLYDCGKAKAFLLGRAGNALNNMAFIAHNGDAAGIVHLTPEAFAIVMPMRGNADDEPPAWFTGKTEEKQAEAA